ncbi:hypothetical protein HPB50_009521 [Hyalomma asiaticum]|uniref:Uncharacterized protein n=1 Tax=Hyalomma asiaticum TaxID=266040 RepID=A0ACB7RJV8_HYAAI|nr:hypothetical protein HPB50_009521 [Hyalomma asiaticum]
MIPSLNRRSSPRFLSRLEPSYCGKFAMSSWEYTLTGFGDFYEQRRIAFTEPMPVSRVCNMCGRVPSSSIMLPCGHSFVLEVPS